jgi:hypothetical protein
MQSSSSTIYALLEIWAAWYIADGQTYRRLWYPNGTPEHRYARAGGVRNGPIQASIDVDDAGSTAEVFDKVMAKLRLHKRRWFDAVAIRTLDRSPIELQAQVLHTNVKNLQRNYDGGIRWLRREISSIGLD